VQVLRPESGQSPDQMFPVSHTCFFGLDIPLYTSADVLEKKLAYAIENCSSIDADASLQQASGQHNDEEDDEEWGFA